MDIADIKTELQKLADPKRAESSAWFFKTGEGEYGHGDIFLGITVPVQRKVAHKFIALPLGQISKLIKSPVHEHRFVALEILVAKYEKGDGAMKKKVAAFYLKNTKHINNWDLVDTSAGYILGDYLIDKDKSILFKLAKSKNLWQRRISIIATQNFIAKNRFTETLQIAEVLLYDNHDLIHKAVGWMLREVGKRDLATEIAFLDKHYKKMPRTMLRYAIERFPEKERRYYLAKNWQGPLS